MRKCAVCGKEFESYEPIEQKYIDLYKKTQGEGAKRTELINREEYSCPYCYAVDRDRMIVMFVSMMRSCMKDCINILEIAPSGALKKYLYKYWGETNYYTADLYMDGVDYNADIQNMTAIGDETFDFIVCSHVLEHVQDDMRAMRELYRILERDGLGIIIVPLDLNRVKTDEAWGLSEEENIRRFGQADHVRAYSKKDYIARLEQSGFSVWQLDKSFFSREVFEENALIETSTLYLVYKNKIMYNNRGGVIERFRDSHLNKRDNIKDYSVSLKKHKCWVDVCEIHDNLLKIWGWVYIIKANSRNSKLKIMLKSRKKEYIFGTDLRSRDDIQKTFGSECNNYSFSGIDFSVSLDGIENGDYSVYILLKNEMRRYRIKIKRNLKIECSC